MPEGEVLWMIATPSCYSGLLGFNPFGVWGMGVCFFPWVLPTAIGI